MITGDDLTLQFIDGKFTPLETALLRLGWTPADYHEGSWRTWNSMGEASVIIPLDESRADFPRLMRMAMSTLSRVVSPEALERAISEAANLASLEKVPALWRKESPTVPGTIPWLIGQRLHENVGHQIAALVKSTVEPKSVLGRGAIYASNYYLERTLLAPSGVGSYVLTALMPTSGPIFLKEQPKQTGKKPKARPSIESSDVIRTFDTAMAVVREAISAGDKEEAVKLLKDSASAGVSAELLSSLSEFASETAGQIQVPSHVWRTSSTPTEYVLEPSHVPVLQQAANELIEQEPTPATVSGVVSAVKKDPEDAKGLATILTTSLGPVRRVRARFEPEVYDRIVEAHRKKSLVRLLGDLSKDGRYWEITPTSLEVFGEHDDVDDHVEGPSSAMLEPTMLPLFDDTE